MTNHDPWRHRYVEERPARGGVDWLNAAVWIGGVFGPWLVVVVTVAYLEGWL